jgi:hypothetical protein
VNATRALSGPGKQDPDDALVNGEFVSQKVIGKHHPFDLPPNFSILEKLAASSLLLHPILTASVIRINHCSCFPHLFVSLLFFPDCIQWPCPVNQKKLSSGSILPALSVE